MLIKKRTIVSLLQINLLIISLFAFSFVINSGLVGGQELDPAWGLGGEPPVEGGVSGWEGVGGGGGLTDAELDSILSGGQGKASATQTLTGGGNSVVVAKGASTGLTKAMTNPKGVLWTPKGATSPFMNNILAGAQWALAAYGVVQLVAPMLGLEQSTTDALSAGAAAGFGN